MDPTKVQENSAVDKFEVQVIIDLIKKYRLSLDESSSALNLQGVIVDGFLDFSNTYIALGSSEFRKHNELGKIDELGAYLLHYSLSEPFKDILFLHRDVLLQLSIAKHKKVENLVDDNAINVHFLESKKVLLDAVESFAKKVQLEQKQGELLNNTKSRLASKLKHLQNPWAIYEDQYSAVREQLIAINVSGKSFEQDLEVFEAIRNHTVEACQDILKEAEQMSLSLEEGIKTIESLTEVSQIQQTLVWLEKVASKIDLVHPLQENFTSYLESRTSTMGKIDLPIAASEGMLLTKKMDLGKAAQKWLDYMPLPYFIDLWDNRVQAISYFKHALLNLENALILDKANSSLETLSVQLDGFRNVGSPLKDYLQKQEKVVAEIQNMMRTEFLGTHIYRSDHFLEVSLQSSIFQLASHRKGLFARLGGGIKKFLSRLGSKYEQNVAANPSQSLEQAMQCMEYRMFKEENAHYDTLFLNRNFVGDLFLVERPEEEQKVAQSINAWQSGIHKSILVLGNPLSGKSTFMEQLAKKHFGKQVVFLRPDSDIIIEGRKFKTSNDLGEALNSVRKSIYNTRPAVVIDNLELWRGKDHPFLENVKALLDFLDLESDHVFLMVSISEMLKTHLDHRLPFSNTFSNEVNIEKTDFNTIYKAILLRNGASHRILVDEKENTLTDKQIEHSVRRLCRSFDYNLGEVLQAWTYGTTMISENLVIYNDRNILFADFFTPQELLILKYVALFTYINEITLKDFLGKRFDQTYRSGLRRLTNTKVLLRDDNGDLRINAVLAHDIRELLKYHGIMK